MLGRGATVNISLYFLESLIIFANVPHVLLATVLAYDSATVYCIESYWDTLTRSNCNTVLQCHSAATLQSYSVIVILFYCARLVASQSYSATVLQHCWATVSTSLWSRAWKNDPDEFVMDWEGTYSERGCRLTCTYTVKHGLHRQPHTHAHTHTHTHAYTRAHT